ncbi:LnmK family bifunctional acyltransferase/decarboxylase [Streptomyces sp. NPDC004296]|uniref:LnmK family bifunctional acyltransferase/decarboxylase n=1 Tax=Streptomyces sp. NPDC004296 TaxID=3364697 RepID=UPI0036831BF0
MTTTPTPTPTPVTASALTAPALDIRQEVKRTITVRPGMCGPNSLFQGQLGDWTWETVSALCGTDVFAARDTAGNPTYLAFYYFRVRGSRTLHQGALTFGDRLTVTSGCYDQGSESVLTLHRLDRTGTPGADRPLDLAEFYDHPREGSLYVENFNRWVTRSTPGSNQDLVKASPPDFRHEGLPALPVRYSPRAVYRRARSEHTFRDRADRGYRPLPGIGLVEHPVDLTRDVNGVGLLYFASYFALADKAALALWRQRDRSDAAFLRRTVLDQKICYLGNADLDSVLVLSATSRVSTTDPGDELTDVVIRDRGTQRVIAVSTLHTVHDPEGEAA